MRRAVVIAVLASSLAACQKSDSEVERDLSRYAGVARAPAADAAAAPAADAGGAGEPGGSEPASAPVAAGAPMLAYAYAYVLSLPSPRVDEVRRRHEAACTGAGYRVCQVVRTSISERNSGDASGDLVLRATPAWLKRFQDSLAGDAKGVGGKLLHSEVTSEDLSREIVDTSARLKAKIVLRDRLQALLASRPGKVADLLDVERELARVQGEIDSTQSQLAVMQARVSMSEVTIDYQSMGILAPTGPWSPVARSINDFVEILAQSFAAFIRLIAWLAPWALLVAAGLWLFRKRLPKLRWPRIKAARGKPPEAAT